MYTFQIELEFRSVGFLEKRKTRVAGEKPDYLEKNILEQGQEPTTNSTHI